MQQDHIQIVRDRVPGKPLIILATEPARDGNVLDIQNYTIDGELVIPLFSTAESFNRSTAGTVGKPVWSIARALLLHCVKGDEIFLLDPRLSTQLRFTAAELRRAFPDDRLEYQ